MMAEMGVLGIAHQFLESTGLQMNETLVVAAFEIDILGVVFPGINDTVLAIPAARLAERHVDVQTKLIDIPPSRLR